MTSPLNLTQLRRHELWSSANIVAVGTFAVGLLLWACGAFTFFSDHDVYPWPVKLGLLVVAFAIEILARRHRAHAFAAMCVLLAVDGVWGPSLPLWIAMSDVVFLCAAAGGRTLQRVVVSVCTGLTAVLAVVGVMVGGVRVGVLIGLVGIAFLLSPITYALAVSAARRASDAEKTAAISQAHAERTEALADERRRLSRELHDTVAGHVSAIAILSEAARDSDDPGQIVESIRGNSLAALSELRAMIEVLAADGDERITARWGSLGPLIAAAEAVGSSVVVDGDIDELSHRNEAVFTRIAGEALANATRHAPGQRVTIVVDEVDEEVRLTVRNVVDHSVMVRDAASGAADPNRGGATAGRATAGRATAGRTTAGRATAGRGVTNMQIRAASVGGRADAGPNGTEWVVTVRVPR